MDKVDSTQEQMGEVSREAEILRKNLKETREVKNTGTEMKNAFGGLSSSQDKAKERISEFSLQIAHGKKKKKRAKKNSGCKDELIKIFKTENQRAKTEKYRPEYPRTVGQPQKV
jgi:regulator of replication initiation timing